MTRELKVGDFVRVRYAPDFYADTENKRIGQIAVERGRIMSFQGADWPVVEEVGTTWRDPGQHFRGSVPLACCELIDPDKVPDEERKPFVLMLNSAERLALWELISYLPKVQTQEAARHRVTVKRQILKQIAGAEQS